MGTCHKGLLGNLGAKDGAFGKCLGKKMGRNYNQQGLETDGFGVIWAMKKGTKWLFRVIDMIILSSFVGVNIIRIPIEKSELEK